MQTSVAAAGHRHEMHLIGVISTARNTASLFIISIKLDIWAHCECLR